MSLPTLPSGLPPRGRTRTFTESSMPAALLSEHSLGAGRWGVLEVLEGSVEFVDLETGDEHHLEAPREWIIEPERKHHLRLAGPVQCRVNFFGAAKG